MISSAIDAFLTPCTVTRVAVATSFTNGLANTVTSVDEFEVGRCSIQPMRARERVLLPELIRDKEALKMFTTCELRTVDVVGKTMADRVTYRDKTYVVHSIEDWQPHGGFWKAVLVKENT